MLISAFLYSPNLSTDKFVKDNYEKYRQAVISIQSNALVLKNKLFKEAKTNKVLMSQLDAKIFEAERCLESAEKVTEHLKLLSDPYSELYDHVNLPHYWMPTMQTSLKTSLIIVFYYIFGLPNSVVFFLDEQAILEVIKSGLSVELLASMLDEFVKNRCGSSLVDKICRLLRICPKWKNE